MRMFVDLYFLWRALEKLSKFLYIPTSTFQKPNCVVHYLPLSLCSTIHNDTYITLTNVPGMNN